MRQYFATKPREEIGNELLNKVDAYYSFLHTSGRLGLYKKSYSFYYQSYFDKGKTGVAGSQGEYRTIGINQYHNIIQHLLVLATSQRPAWDSKAVNDDYESKSQTILSNGLLEYYMKEKNIEQHLRDAVETSLVFAESFVEACWNANSGKSFGVHPETGAVIYDGDVEVDVFSPLNCIRDFNKTSSKNPSWTILRKTENRFDLISKYPEFVDHILGLPSAIEDADSKQINFLNNYQSDEDSEDVPVYYFYHKPCPSLPDGRLVIFSDKDTVYIDSPLPYRDIPIYRIAPGEQNGTPFGYTVGFDLLPIQETINKLYSVIVTNQLQFGVQSIAVPKGSNLNHNHFSGLNLLEFDPKSGPPTSINFTHTAPEVFNFLNQLINTMEQLSGVNSVIRGEPGASLRSGNALALVASTAVQFSQGLGASYNALLENLGTGIINLLIDYASVPRIATISGKNNRALMKQFKGEDLNRINRVQVMVANPLTKTIAGRVNLAENLLQNQLIKTPDEYLMVLQTGKIEPAIQGQTAELLLVNSENESLSEGREVVPIFSDDHKLHLQEHRSVLASPDARLNPMLVENVLKHMQEHINLLKTTDPNLLQFLGSPALANPQPNNSAPMTAQQQPPQPKQPGMPSLPPGSPEELEAAYEQLTTPKI